MGKRSGVKVQNSSLGTELEKGRIENELHIVPPPPEVALPCGSFSRRYRGAGF
jgi:hypothetical protein